ncbi:protein hinderin [Xenentodon cancila]
MASTTERSGNSEIFWMNGVSDEEQPLVFVPGVDGGVTTKPVFSLGPDSASTSVKRGTKTRVKLASNCKSYSTQKKAGKKLVHLQSDASEAYTKGKVSVHQSAAVPKERAVSQPPETFLALSEVIPGTSRNKSEVSLKDLCLADKRRIANLVEELARVSEEKEESVQRLKDEQGNFERKIHQLEQENVIIEEERKSLHQQYRECQELLSLYQQYLSQQQAKLNQSIAQFGQPPTHSKVLSGEGAPSRTSASRANGSLFDGSYLSLAATGAKQTQVCSSCDARSGAIQMLPNPACLSCDRELGPSAGPAEQPTSQRRECRMPHTCHRCQRCQINRHDAGNGTQDWKSDSGSSLVNNHQDTFRLKEHDRYSSAKESMASEGKDVLTRTLLGQEDWEKKRHKLLLQKMQLEIERERLQARLAEQEEKLNRQTKSGVDYSRTEQLTRAELSSSNTGNGGPELEAPSHQDRPRSVCTDAEAQSVGHGLHEKHSQTVAAPSASRNAESLERSRRDMATSPATFPAKSPVKSPAGPSKANPVSEIPKAPEARLDFSVVELLDIFSPISTSKQPKPSARRPKTLRHRSTLTSSDSAGRILLNPGGSYPQSTQQDLEESQILEDIFFIC